MKKKKKQKKQKKVKREWEVGTCGLWDQIYCSAICPEINK